MQVKLLSEQNCRGLRSRRKAGSTARPQLLRPNPNPWPQLVPALACGCGAGASRPPPAGVQSPSSGEVLPGTQTWEETPGKGLQFAESGHFPPGGGGRLRWSLRLTPPPPCSHRSQVSSAPAQSDLRVVTSPGCFSLVRSHGSVPLKEGINTPPNLELD